MLKLQSREPEWLGLIPSNDPEDPRPFLLPGTRVRFAPIGIKAVRDARAAVRDALGIQEDDILGAGDALSRAIIARGLLEWEGVGDLAGNVIPVTPETVELFVADPRAFEAADQAYVVPWTRRDMEGNGSAGSPPGTGQVATPATDTARSRAKRTSKGAARSVRTGSTSSKATKPKASGTS